MKKTLIILVLALFILGCAKTEEPTQQEQKVIQKITAKTICKSGCDFSTIQSAVNSGEKDLKITDKGTYFETVEIGREGVNLDCNGATIDAEILGKAFLIQSDNNKIENCVIQKSAAGFYIESNGNTIKDNEIKDSAFGIYIVSGDNNVVEGNKVDGCKRSIELQTEEANENVIKGNTVTNSQNEGIALYKASGNTVENNVVENGLKTGIRNRGENNIIRNNKVNNNLAYGIECRAEEMTYEGNSCTGNGVGQCALCTFECPDKC